MSGLPSQLPVPPTWLMGECGARLVAISGAIAIASITQVITAPTKPK